MLTLTVEIAEQDLATLQRYAATHPEVGGLAGALSVAARLLQAAADRSDAAAAAAAPAAGPARPVGPGPHAVAPHAVAPEPASPATTVAPWRWPADEAAS
ncbi:MAG TPA: hypothetical protein PKB06_00770 [Actinotalea sp.]|nr:hypothetical protein [Actinotalea sp.]